MNYIDLKATGGNGAKRNSTGKKGPRAYIPTIVVVILIVMTVLNIGKVRTVLAKMLNPISIVSSVTGGQSNKLKETDGRTNILLLGSDQRSMGEQVGSQLTDTVMLVSVGKTTQDAVLISIPRDLWVQSSTGGYYKINELYASFGGKDGSGSAELLHVVEEVLGAPVHYYAVVNFDLFKQVIAILDGVEVQVETAFTDYFYPIEGKENALPESDRYETVSFAKGLTVMDGETALKYARSRHGDNGEGTDFARARRQQNLMMAIKQKALSAEVLLDFSKVKSLFELYAKNVDTNLDLSSLQLFYTLSQSARFDTIRTLVLDDSSTGENGGLLYAPTDLTLYGGKYVLIPKAGDYSQIHAYMQKYLFD
ncbi:MAG: LCP family protein [bacterium]